MEVYFNLLKALDPKILRLTPVDQVILDDFNKTFGDKKVSTSIFVTNGSVESACCHSGCPETSRGKLIIFHPGIQS